MTFELFARYFNVGDKISVSGGPAWDVVAIIEAEQIVILKRWKIGKSGGRDRDFDIWTNDDLYVYAMQLRKVDT